MVSELLLSSGNRAGLVQGPMVQCRRLCSCRSNGVHIGAARISCCVICGGTVVGDVGSVLVFWLF